MPSIELQRWFSRSAGPCAAASSPRRHLPFARWGLALTIVLLAGCGSDSSITLDFGERAEDPAFAWNIPARIPLPVVPEDNPMTEEKFQLGRHLFYDKRLSANGTIACASCHHQELAFSDGRKRPVGATGEPHPRNAQPLVNVAFNATFNWANPSVITLEEQVMTPLFGDDPIEHGINDGNLPLILETLRADHELAERFRAAFPEDEDRISVHRIVQALATFVRGIVSFETAFDRYSEGDRTAMSSRARRGMDLFFSERFECFHCHGGYNLTNSVFDSGMFIRERPFHNTGLYNIDGLGGYPWPNTGIHEITGRADHMGRFRAPSLRNVAVTAPYNHDGSTETLRDVIRNYASAGRNITEGPFPGDGRMNPFKDGFVVGFSMTDDELEELMAFLEALTDYDILANPRFSDPKHDAPADRGELR